MADSNGWIKLDRVFQDSYLWNKSKTKSWAEAWIDILMQANFEDKKVLIGHSLFECKRGQCLYSLETWAKRWGWTKSAVRRFLVLLQENGSIIINDVKLSTQITVCNYEVYQGTGNTVETQLKRNRNTVETQLKPTKELKNLRTKEFKNLESECQPFIETYGKPMIDAFINYWTEKNTKGEEKWQKQDFFETGKRLATWNSKNYNNKDTNFAPQQIKTTFRLPDEVVRMQQQNKLKLDQ